MRRRHRLLSARVLIAAAAGVAIVAAVAVLALGLPGSGDEPQPWATLDTADVHALAFVVGESDRLLYGHHGGLLRSDDGGRTWAPASLSGADAMRVAVGRERIQIAGHDVYLESTDGGATWQPVPNDLPGLDIHAFVADPADDARAWAFVAGSGLFETTDGGRRWELRQAGNWGFLTAYGTDSGTALVAVGAEGLVRSDDGGRSWEPLAYPGAPLAGGLAAASDGSALYAATTTGLKRSDDEGQSWTETAFDRIALAIAVDPTDPSRIAVVDDATRFYRSADAGRSWPSP